jgi:hypothetical protein
VGHGGVRVEEEPAVAEGVWRDVDHAHDQRVRAQRELAGAEAPG